VSSTFFKVTSVDQSLKNRKFYDWFYRRAMNVKLLLMQQLEMSVFETQENLAVENLTMKTRNALCHIQVVILYSKTSSYISS